MNEKYPFENSEIYQKSDEIFKLCTRIELICRDSQMEHADILNEQAQRMISDAVLMSSKLAGAWSVEIYDIKMENACLIRKAAMDILLGTTGLKTFGFEEQDYLMLLRQEIEAFRILFAEWVKTFDPWNYHIDRWGLFNPPGVEYDDHDPDDDLPLDSDDF